MRISDWSSDVCSADLIILVGDVKQLGSVEAGAAFAQLQSAGMETAKLAEIVRQTNAATKEAVLASIEGDAKKALAALDRSGGQIIENADRSTRFEIGRAHVLTPVTNAHLVCRLLLEKKNKV